MLGATKICKICGKEYPCCRTRSANFRYQDVACCPEHAAEYFKKVEAARNISNDSEPPLPSQNENAFYYDFDVDDEEDIDEELDYSVAEEYEE